MNLEDFLSIYVESVKLAILIVDLEILTIRSNKASHSIDLENLCLQRCVRIKLSVLILGYRLALLVRNALFGGTIGSDIDQFLISYGDPGHRDKYLKTKNWEEYKFDKIAKPSANVTQNLNVDENDLKNFHYAYIMKKKK